MKKLFLLFLMFAVCSYGIDVPDIVTEYSDIPAAVVQHPVYDKLMKGSVDVLKSNVAAVMALSEKELQDLLPVQTGIWFCGCPVEGCLNPQGSAFIWDISSPHTMKCKTCGTVFPNEKYPLEHETTVTAPSGVVSHYHYYERDGMQYYMEAGIEYRKRIYFERISYNLAALYHRTGNEEYGRRAMLIMLHFARHYDDFAYRFEYPFTNPEFYDGMPKFDLGYRHGRITNWYWWYYGAIPIDSAMAYDFMLAHPEFVKTVADEYGVDFKKTMEDDFILRSSKDSLLNEERFSNMSPYHWASLVQVAQITGNSDLFHIVRGRINKFFETMFLPDGWWCEIANGYHKQAYSIMNRVMGYMVGFSDPVGTQSMYASSHVDNYSIDELKNLTVLPEQRYKQMFYPDGAAVACNDGDLDFLPEFGKVQQSYLAPYGGIAMLAAGTDDNPIQLYPQFTAKYGHNHWDRLNLCMFANHSECLTDLGYTHTHLREYTAGSASHNLVVKDMTTQKSTAPGARLLFAELDCPYCQVVECEARDAYDDLSDYRRCSFLIPVGDTAYAADFFFVKGKYETLDYFFHGNLRHEDTVTFADENGTLASVASDMLTPELRATWKMATMETDYDLAWQKGHIYGYFDDVKKYQTTGGAMVASFSNSTGARLNVHFPARQDVSMEAYTGRGPGLRGTLKQQNPADKFFRGFACIRIAGKAEENEAAVLNSILEPAPGTVMQCVALAPNVLKIELADRTDIVFADVKNTMNFHVNGCNLNFRGAYGFVAVGKDGQVMNAYASNGTISGNGKAVAKADGPKKYKVLAADGKHGVTISDAQKQIGTEKRFVRIKMADGRAYGNFINGIRKEDDVQLLECTGIRNDGAGWRWINYPYTKINGQIQLECFSSDWLGKEKGE